MWLIVNGVVVLVGFCDVLGGGLFWEVVEFVMGCWNDCFQQFQWNVVGEQVDYEMLVGVVVKYFEQWLFVVLVFQVEVVVWIDVGGEDEMVVDFFDGYGLFFCCFCLWGGVEEVCI